MISLGCKFLGSSAVIEQRRLRPQRLWSLPRSGQDEILEAPGAWGHGDPVQQLLVGLQLGLVAAEKLRVALRTEEVFQERRDQTHILKSRLNDDIKLIIKSHLF